ncbi:MAG: long-chain fatty acid--CoA ligase [Ruminococcaceae bacterium]|nr:long-chain fatty acid--CoA ligase [Oscillospiraceae bacterium]
MSYLTVLKDAPRHDLIRDYLLDAVEAYGEKDAFVLKQESKGKNFFRHISYNSFWEELRAFGQGLRSLGLGEKRIAVIGLNSYEWILTYLSVLCGVGVIVPLDKELTEPEVLLSLKRSGVSAVVCDEKHLELMRSLKNENNSAIEHVITTKKLAPELPSIGEIRELGSLALKEDPSFDRFSPDPDAIASIIFTSGTTSSSKAVMLSNKNIATNLYDLLRVEEIYPEDRNLVFLPLHHTFGSVGLTYFLCSGATNMFCDGLRHVQKNLKEYKITTFVCVPLLLEVMYRNIWRGIEKQGKTKLVKNALKISEGMLKMGIDVRRKLFKSILAELGGELRFIISGASAISREVAKGFNDFGILTVQGYGLTETSPVLTAENPKNIRYGSVGKAFPSVSITIENPGEDGIGEICARGGNVMLGYYEMPEETNAVLKNGVFHTGDLGRLDEDGFLFITGRKKNVIVLKSGKNIYPEELEEILSKLPFISEVMVYGKKKEDDLLVSAKIVYSKEFFRDTMPDKTEADFAAYMKNEVAKVNETLPAYKHVKHLTFQTQPLIKTSTAKVKRYEEIAKEN